MLRKEFERLVAEAIDDLPEEFAAKMDNVAIVIEEEATPALKASMGMRPFERLLGVYQGIPLTQRSSGYSLTPPDKIVIFQRAFDELFHSERRKKAEIRKTVMHEIAHHFGLSDARLHELERGNSKR